LKPKHWFVFILLGIIWSSSFLWIKIAVQEIGPMTLVAFRVLFGFMFTVVAIIIQRSEWPRNRQIWFSLIILGLTNIAIPFFLISWGEQTIDSAVAAVLDATVPLFTIVLAHHALHDDKMTLPKVAGLLVGFFGVIVLLSKDLLVASHASVLGQVAVIVACVFYAGSSVFARKFTEGASGLVRASVPLFAANIIMWIAVPFTESPLKIPALPITWIALLWLGILGSGLAITMNYYLLHEIGPTRTTMVTYIFPLGGVLLGVVFLGEQLTWQLAAGGALIISGIAFGNWNPKKEQ
jgi:drug/metabolite transporter (DMT)-like permease